MHCLRLILPAVLAVSAQAGELTLEMKPFSISHTVSATVLPKEATGIRLDAVAWTDFKVKSIAEHGSSVAQGDSLLVFETREIDKKIEDTRQAVATGKLELIQAEADLASLEKEVPEKLARLTRNAEKADADLAYFIATDRKISEESAGFDLKRSEQILSSYREELKQLLQMYEADDITEDTEEIILRQQRDTVEAAEFALRKEILNHKRTLETTIPRESIQLTEERDDTALALEKGTADLPRSIEVKKTELAGLRIALDRNMTAIADLESDRSLFEIKAPSEGIFYLGAIHAGKWSAGEAVKSLVPQGSAPVGQTFATFIPAAAELVAVAFLDQDAASSLAPGASGTGFLAGHGEMPIPVTLVALPSAPDPDLTYAAVFAAEWPEGLTPAAGQSLEIRLITHNVEKAIALPSDALEFGPQGWTAEVKLADGKNGKRPVIRGKSSVDETEILSGLEPGQVVIVPER